MPFMLIPRKVICLRTTKFYAPALLFLVLIAMPCYADVTTGLIGHWEFDEGMGTTAADASGNNNTGTLVNGPAVVQGKSALGLSFDGINDYVISNNNLGISGNAEFTMCAWIYWNNPAWSADYPSFMGNNSIGVSNEGLSFTVQAGRPAIDFWNNRFRATTPLIAQTWNHLCGTKTPGIISSTTTLYVNGSSVAGAVENSDVAPNIGNFPAIIGRLDAGRWFNGYVDEVRVYNRALTAGDVAELYQKNAVPKDGLVAWWTFDEGSGTTVRDPVGNNTGTLVNSPTFVPGKSGKALSFNGTTQGVSITGSPSFATANSAFAVSVWVKLANFSVRYPHILTLQSDSGTNPWELILSNDASYLGVLIGSTTTWAKEKTNTPAASFVNSWHHISVSYSGAGAATADNFTIYLDGVLTAHNAAADFSSLSNSTTIALPPAGGSVNIFSGLIDDVRIYNRALTASEVLALYRDGNGPVVTSAGTVKGISTIRF